MCSLERNQNSYSYSEELTVPKIYLYGKKKIWIIRSYLINPCLIEIGLNLSYRRSSGRTQALWGNGVQISFRSPGSIFPAIVRITSSELNCLPCTYWLIALRCVPKTLFAKRPSSSIERCTPIIIIGLRSFKWINSWPN